MKHKRQPRRLSFLRRSFALFLAAFALWLLSLACDFNALCARLGENSAFISAVLQAGFGAHFLPEDGLWEQFSPWQQLALSQSSHLRYSAPSDGAPTEPSETPSPAPQDTSPSPQVSVQTQPVREQTLPTQGGTGSLSAAGIHIFNYTSLPVDVQTVASAQISVSMPDEGPQILIIHTHGSEAYTMDESDIYQESDAWRTADTNYNVVRVGSEIAQVLESMGLQVVHDQTLHDYPQYDGAYSRSYNCVRQWLEQYPSIQVVLDIHRDALSGEDGTILKPVTDVNGEKSAQVLMIVGTNDMGQDHPDWTDNLALAVRIQQQLGLLEPTLARPVTLRSASFNQQLSPGFLLVEVGSHGNTLQEALAAGRLFARAAGEALLSLKEKTG